jgi:hypothetical protein
MMDGEVFTMTCLVCGTAFASLSPPAARALLEQHYDEKHPELQKPIEETI